MPPGTPTFTLCHLLQRFGQHSLQLPAIGRKCLGHGPIACALGQHFDGERRPFRLAAQRVEVLQERQHLRAITVGHGQPLQQRRQFLALGHGHCKDDRFLAREVVVEIAQADVGRLRDVTHAGLVESLGEEALQGGLQDLRVALRVAVGSVHGANNERTFVQLEAGNPATSELRSAGP